MSTLKIQNPVPPPLEIIYFEDDGTTRGGHVTVPSTIHNMSITFGASILNAQSDSMKRQRTLSTGKIFKSERTFRRVDQVSLMGPLKIRPIIHGLENF